MDAIATTAGISGQRVQDLMLECVEKRFGALKPPHPVEWLADNGSCYTAKETVVFASMLGLLSRFTPVRSPHPHKGLWMKSSREFIRSPATAGCPV